MFRFKVAALAVAASTGFALPAQATLIGDVVNAQWSFDSSPSAVEYFDTAIVGSGVEFISNVPSGGGFFDEADFTDSSVTLIYRSANPDDTGFGGKIWTFSELDWVGDPSIIVNVVADPNNPTGASIGAIGPDSFQIILPDLQVFPGSPVSWSFDIVTAQLPEPSTIAGFAIGLFGLAVAVRRRRSKTSA